MMHEGNGNSGKDAWAAAVAAASSRTATLVIGNIYHLRFHIGLGMVLFICNTQMSERTVSNVRWGTNMERGTRQQTRNNRTKTTHLSAECYNPKVE